MSNDESIIVAFPPEMCKAFRAKAAERGIKQGSRAEWSILRKKLEDSGAFTPDDIYEFTIHLRILADLYLSFAMGESNLPKLAEQCKTAIENLRDARSYAKKLNARIASDSVKAALPSDSKLIGELSKAIEALDIAITQQRIPTSSRNPVRMAEHALAQNFEALWECYTGRPIKGNRKAYSIAKSFFHHAGFMPRTKAKSAESGELADISQKFDRARSITKNLRPMTPVRKLTQQERELYSYLAF